MDLSQHGLEETQHLVREISSSVEIALHITNVSISSEVENMVKTCVSTFGRLDFSINNAGIALAGVRTTDTTSVMYDKMVDVNEKGVSQLSWSCGKCEP